CERGERAYCENVEGPFRPAVVRGDVRGHPEDGGPCRSRAFTKFREPHREVIRERDASDSLGLEELFEAPVVVRTIDISAEVQRHADGADGGFEAIACAAEGRHPEEPRAKRKTRVRGAHITKRMGDPAEEP